MANINNENENRNTAAGQSGKKPGTPRKKLNVVFRKQNSTSIKELPKGLKKAADGRGGADKDGTRRDTAVRKPRPLPAGTKPVRPAAKNAAREEGSQKLRQQSAQDNIRQSAGQQSVQEPVRKTGGLAGAAADALSSAARAVTRVVQPSQESASAVPGKEAQIRSGVRGGSAADAEAFAAGIPAVKADAAANEVNSSVNNAGAVSRRDDAASKAERAAEDMAGSGTGAAGTDVMKKQDAKADSGEEVPAGSKAAVISDKAVTEKTGSLSKTGDARGAVQAAEDQGITGAGPGGPSSLEAKGQAAGASDGRQAEQEAQAGDQGAKVSAEGKGGLGKEPGTGAAGDRVPVSADAAGNVSGTRNPDAAMQKTGKGGIQDMAQAAVMPGPGSSTAEASAEKAAAAKTMDRGFDKRPSDKKSAGTDDVKPADKKQDNRKSDRKQSDRKSDRKPSPQKGSEGGKDRKNAAGQAGAAASGTTETRSSIGMVGTDQALPKVKIVKSYANYDVAAIIAEASRKAKKEKSQAQAQAGAARNNQRDGAARNRGGEGQGQGDRKSSGRTFVSRNNTGGAGTATGQQSGARGQRPQTGGQAAPDRKGSGAGSSGRSFDQGKGKDQRGRNAHNARDGRKDKYVDDLSANLKTKNGKGAFVRPEPKKEKPEEEIKVITIPQTLTIKELAEKMHLQPSAIVKKLFLEGRMVTPNTDLGYDEAEEIAMEYDILCEKEVEVDVIAELIKDEEDDESRLVARNPVVCVMGHVDHGKTSLLDAIRNTNVTSHEAGGITQHIGASVVQEGDRHITFLDTPGHEAFTAMRLRGAQSTDIAVLVVAADDGVKPQTVEAINHAKAAGVEVIVAINKMDKPHANPDMVRKELSDYGLISEDWGGKTPMVEVSAKTGAGISDLLDIILLQADVMELRADPKRRARGLVIEAQLDKGRGPVATVLVQKGTLRVGDYVVAGECFGRVRAMVDDKHKQVKQVPPSYPAEILGLSDVPNAGEVFMVCRNEREARDIASAFVAEHKKRMLEETKKKMNLDDLFDEIKAGNIKELPIIVKADVQGSVEAVKQSLGKLSNEEVAVKVIHSAAGNINESDVSLASASNAIIIGFNVKPDPLAKAQAEQEKIDMRLYKVIYQAIDDLNAALTGMLAPVYEPQNIGRAIVRQIFKSSGVGIIAGCYVTDGVVERGSRARLYRGDKMLFDGDIASLKRFKDEVKEVKLGFECGIVLDGFSDIEVDDNLEIYKMVQVPRT